MACPHSTRDMPDRCSQCLGIQPQRVSIEPGAMRDVPARDYYQRGARHSHNRTRKT